MILVVVLSVGLLHLIAKDNSIQRLEGGENNESDIDCIHLSGGIFRMAFVGLSIPTNWKAIYQTIWECRKSGI